jgi:hypothetical protein
VIDFGNLLPGQNFEQRPPYLLALTVGEAAPHLDPWQHTIELAPAGAAQNVTWRTFPTGTKVTIDDQPLAGGTATMTLSASTTLKLTAPDGRVVTWRLVAPAR